MAPRSDDFDRYLPETQMALIRADIVQIHRELDELRGWLRTLEQRPLLTEAQAKELCRDIVAEELKSVSSERENAMRIATLVCTLVTVAFIIYRSGVV